MLRTTCPSCGAELTFRSAASVYAVCASCGSTVVRTDTDVTAIGTTASLPEEVTPLQLGTTLDWQGRRFTILGRLRLAWEDGFWTEWFIDDGGGASGWLTEAQGLLAVSSDHRLPPSLAAAALPALGEVAELAGGRFRVADIKRATCLGAEGELPFAAPRGRAATYVDMVSETAAFAGLEEAEDGRRLYVGRYVSFQHLGFLSLRELEGWPLPRPAADRRLDPRYALGG